MIPRIPIYTKVIVLFAINLLVIGLVGALLLRRQLSSDLDTMLGKQVADRLTEISGQIREDVHQLQISTWDEALAEFGEKYEVDLYLFNIKGEQFAGAPISLPEEIVTRLRSSSGADRNELNDSSERRGPASPRERSERPPRGKRPGSGPPRNFFVKSSHPAGYWFATRLPINPPRSAHPEPGILIARTNSLFGTGVLIDLKPWFWTAGGVFLLSAVLWFPLVRDLTASVQQMTNATEQIADGDFDVAVNDKRRDELGRLGHAINEMAQRLSGFVTGQRRFLSDTAHELCAPIARMQMALGILEQRADEKSRNYVQDVHEELQHMSDLISELMSLSKAGIAREEIELQRVELKALVESVVQRETKGARPVDIVIAEDTLVMADPDLLGRAVSNVIRNSIRHGGDANRIVILEQIENNKVTLSIEDSGPGVPEEDLPKLFDPFYRVDKVRTPGEGGTGLGLAIVKTCVTACKGTVTIENSEPHGLRLNLTFRSGKVVNEQPA